MRAQRASRSQYRYQWVQSLQREVIRIFNAAKAEGQSHGWILQARTDRIFGAKNYGRLTYNEQATIRGSFDVLMMLAWNDVVWMLGPASGPVRESGTDWTEEP